MTYYVEFGHKLNQQELQEQLDRGIPQSELTKFARNYFFELTPENIQKWRDRHNNIDVYMTPYRYNSQPIREAIQTANLYFDFDSEDITKSLADLKRTIEILKQAGCPENSMQSYFSGSKGYHLEIDFSSLGIEPSKELNRLFEAIANDLTTTHQLNTLDTGIYDNVRMWRMNLSINSKTGLYKTPLSFQELSLSGDEIQALAKQPRKDFIYHEHPDAWTSFIEYADQIKKRINYQSPGQEKFDVNKLQNVKVGNRTKTLLKYARSQLAKEYDEEGTLTNMLLINRTFDPPLSEEKVKATFESARKYAQEQGDDLMIGAKDTLNFTTGKRDNLPQEKTRQKNNLTPIEVSKIPWPQSMAEEAFIGLAGQVVKLIEPHTESDPVALLINFLTAFGNIIGDGAYCVIESQKHPCRIFSCIVGKTSKARKGTSWGQIKALFGQIDPDWKITGGASSGEGIIWVVRDKIVKINKKGESEVIDEGVDDKRLLLIEAEFVSVLHVMSREKNTLSSIIRKAWEDGNLRSLTKNSPAQATKSHISIIGHITEDELVRFLSDTDVVNGFGNRFLWFSVRRSKLLPRGGGSFDITQQFPLHTRLAESITFAKTAGEIKMSQDAWKIWDYIYESLSGEQEGLVGSMLGRIEAYARRLSVSYALLDKSLEVKPEHLFAALAVLDYVFDSVLYIFQDRTGDPIANRILNELKTVTDGMTQTDISALFSRHESANKISASIEYLLRLNRIVRKTIATGGRPITLFSLNSLFSQHTSAKMNGYLLKAKQFAKEAGIIDDGEISEKSEEIYDDSIVTFTPKHNSSSAVPSDNKTITVTEDEQEITNTTNEITKNNTFDLDFT